MSKSQATGQTAALGPAKRIRGALARAPFRFAMCVIVSTLGFPFTHDEYLWLIRMKLVKEYGKKPGFDVAFIREKHLSNAPQVFFGKKPHPAAQDI